MTELFAEVNGIKLCYEIDGPDDGEPIFLIHGFGVKKEVFIAQIKALSEKFRVIRVDNRGSGKSDRPNQPYTTDLLAEDLKCLMDYLKIGHAHILGYSLGGMVAQTFALNYPEKVSKLILINTTPSFPSNPSGIESYKQGKIARYHSLLEDPVKTFYDNATPGFTRNFKKILLAEPKKKIHGIFSAEDLIEMDRIDPTTPQDIENSTHLLLNFDVLEKLPNIRNETLIITATHDRTLPRSQNEIIHENIPNSKLVVIEKAGHDSVQEKAPEINQAILDFLVN
ncbi:MAG: alpha/beta hydrolase [Candidatus Lokiarchaeota archaeon]|nr:alpha/beta hydrolase [Candidatus Lokiarchaeota archaeon]